MNKIGNTSTGSVIVEMTSQEYKALEQITNGAGSSKISPPVERTGYNVMTHSERVDFVSPRLKKLAPKKRDGVVRSISAMFQFTGGIEADETEAVISTLQKNGYFKITPEGKVSYKN